MLNTMSALPEGPLYAWLTTQRQALNARFRQAQRRFPQLDAEATLAVLRELLPGLAADSTEGTNDLLSSLYDLILLHLGRGTLAPTGGSSPGIHALLAETFPRLRRLLLARPRSLPGALSNAVENLGPQGVAFAQGLGGLADTLATPDELLDAGAVLAWRLGDARLRGKALEIAARLPPRVVLGALGLETWPEPAAPLLVAGLAADGWHRPEAFLGPATLDRLATADALDKLREQLVAPRTEPVASWVLAGRLGNFTGFDGHFDQPPRLLDAGSQASRHRFWVRSGKTTYRLDADAFGWVCRLDGSVDFADADKRRGAPEHPLLADARSAIAADAVRAFTRADSFRVRVLVPPRRPV
jgi:hypothetical protein